MKNIYTSTAILLICFSQVAIAQYNSGDDELNKSLLTIDADAKLDFGAFKVDLSGSFNITEKKIDYLSVDIGMSAGDIYMSVELAKVTDKTIDQVVEVYQANKTKGWGAMAKELGIKPGSSEFHALKGKAKDKGSKGKGKGKGKGKN